MDEFLAYLVSGGSLSPEMCVESMRRILIQLKLETEDLRRETALDMLTGATEPSESQVARLEIIERLAMAMCGEIS